MAEGKAETKSRRKPPYRAKLTVKNSHTSPAKIELAKKRAEALGFRSQGYSFAQIAHEMKCGLSTAHEWVSEELAAIPREPAKQVMAMELSRLDIYQSAVSPAATEGDIAAIDACLRISDRRARLLGLYSDGKQTLQIATGAAVNGAGRLEQVVQIEFVVPGPKSNGHDTSE